MSALVLRGDAAALPLPDESVDLIVTSPPYFGLRSYTDGGEHYAGQIGSEATPREFLEALWACTREWMRVLRPEGSIFVNLGDKYAAGHGGRSTEGNGDNIRVHRDRPAAQHWAGEDSHPSASRAVIVPGFRPKTLFGMPWRYALGCIDDLGLILRAEIVWAKPNGLPESVTDRVRRSHEQVFHFTRQPRYFSAVDEVREAHTGNAHGSGAGTSRRWLASTAGGNHRALDTDPSEYNPLGKLPGSVWEIPSQPLTVPEHLGVDHFAAFPMELPRRIILGWSPSGICTACGQGRRPVAETAYVNDRRNKRPELRTGFDRQAVAHRKPTLSDGPGATTITGYACACPDATAPTRPATVVDPFGGTGTTALVASAYGRTGISVDRSADYCRLARWRVSDPAERARAMQVPKPPPVTNGQGELFEVTA